MVVISREKAKKECRVSFFTGEPCAYGHIAPRYTQTCRCYECQRLRANKNYRDYPEKAKARAKRTYINTRPRHIAASKAWAANNPEKIRAIKKKNKLKHRLRYRAREVERVRLKCATDPVYRLDRRLSKAVWSFMRGGKVGKKWHDIVGYDLGAIKQRLESLFRDGMNWENYGSVWEVDHIKPKSWFVGYPTPDEAVRAAWALGNLQPLEVGKNRSKGARFEG